MHKDLGISVISSLGYMTYMITASRKILDELDFMSCLENLHCVLKALEAQFRPLGTSLLNPMGKWYFS